MSHRKLFTAVMLVTFVCLSSSAYAEKSVYVISSQDYSIVMPFLIDGDNVTPQSTSVLKQEAGRAAERQ